MSQERRTVTREIIIACVALLISGLTAAGSLLQTHVIAQQLSSQVWPYVTIASTASRTRLEMNVDNDGLGPAVVESFVVMVDGRPQHDILAAVRALVGRQKLTGKFSELDLSALSPGQVLRPESTTMLLRMTNERLVPVLVPQISARVSARLCYCSIVNTCWSLYLPEHLKSARPQTVAQCPDESANQLQQPDIRELQRQP
jgi:hypothetical protein